MIIILLIIYFSLFSLFKFEISISAIYILILKDFRTVTLRTDTTDTPTNRDASHLKIVYNKSCATKYNVNLWSFCHKPKNHTMYTVHISCLYTCTVCDGFGWLVCFRYAVTVCASEQHRLLLTSWVWLCQMWILQITLYSVRWFECKFNHL